MGLFNKKQIVTCGDGGQLVWRNYSDVTEFAEAAEDDVAGDAIDNLDFIIEQSAEDDLDSAGYAKEAKDIVNQKRLGKN
jgi:hypothetical protein